MERHQLQKCKWEGCRSSDVVLGDLYCLEHKRQYHQGRLPQLDKSLLHPDKHQAFPGSISHPPPGLPRTAAATFTNRVTENGSLNNFSSVGSGTSSPTNEKKQLPDKMVARKSTKQPPGLGQPPIASAASPIRRPAKDTPSISPRQAKKPRLSSVTNGPEFLPRSNSSSFSENGIPHPSKRGMFRQSEERTRKLSAVDDFALRPKKKEAANESSGSKAYDDQRTLHRGESHRSSSSRQTPTLSRTPQATSLNRQVGSGSFVIDLTNDDNPEPPLSRPKQPQPRPRKIFQAQQSRPVEQGSRNLHAQKLPQNTAPSTSALHPTFKPVNGISREPPISKQNPNIPAPSNGTGSVRTDPGISTHQHDIPSINERQVANGIRQFPPNKKISVLFNPDRGRLETEPTTSKKPTKAISQVTSAPNAIMTPKPQASEIEPPRQANGTKPTAQHEEPAAILDAALALQPQRIRVELPHQNNGRQPVVQNEKPASTPNATMITQPQAMDIDSPRRTNGTQPAAQNEKSTTPNAAMITQPQAMELDSPHQISRKQPAARSEEHAPTTPINELRPTIVIPQGPLSALLGGREWKKMTPEERRLFWVSQHDPVKFDAQIYSENNRPFRPGGALFGVAEYMLPPRPTRPATSFDYIDPRTHYSQQYSEDWYQQKQAEISTRGNWKANRETLKENRRDAPTPKPSPKQKQKLQDLPQHVRDNPKWLAALGVLENLEAQARDRRANKVLRRTAKEKAKATMNAELDTDADVESS
ncbi:hypothetical protein HD806DRAFT_520523 [Xylariaceae sp. AK1471]|nr:hypothetical protein HD806DRAFT_520523 [Xylariaceae sp. AK1471]